MSGTSEKLKGHFVWSVPVEFLLKWSHVCKRSMDVAE